MGHHRQVRFDAVWIMGVWERSPAGIAIANQTKNLVDDFRAAPPDFRPEDKVWKPVEHCGVWQVHFPSFSNYIFLCHV
jgi:hypothetical protein